MALLTQPDGNRLAAYNITNSPFTSSTATMVNGDHTIEIRNVGTQPVTVKGAIYNSPIAQQGGGVNIQDNPLMQTYIAYGVAILAGVALIIAGIVLLIIGAIKYARSGKTSENVAR
jgi:hypothetical protein